jgi:exonuclease SbcD
MLRILHTADWHLGQTFYGFDRDYEHGVFLDWLLRTLVERSIDVLLIAGDIFDSVNPSAAAQRRFYDFLARTHTALPKLQIVLTAGNHDAGARLEAPAGLLESLNITVVGTVPRDDAGMLDYRRFVVPLRDAEGKVAALALAVPFLRPADVPEVPEAVDAYLDGIRELYRCTVEAAKALREQEHPQAVLVALGHCHVQGGEESRDSERRIVIGGAEALRTDTFPTELAYVALGHLHRPQQFEGGRLHYSGSPIPLSFSEKDYQHRVVEVVIDEAGGVTFGSVLIPKTAMLQRVPAGKAGPMVEVLQLLAALTFDETLPPGAHPFLEVRVLDDGPDPARRRRIEEVLAGKAVRFASLRLEALPRPTESSALVEETAPSLADLSALDPEDILLAAHQERHGREPEAAVLAAFREILAAEAHAPVTDAP